MPRVLEPWAFLHSTFSVLLELPHSIHGLSTTSQLDICRGRRWQLARLSADTLVLLLNETPRDSAWSICKLFDNPYYTLEVASVWCGIERVVSSHVFAAPTRSRLYRLSYRECDGRTQSTQSFNSVMPGHDIRILMKGNATHCLAKDLFF
jgi:hypothetical protein